MDAATKAFWRASRTKLLRAAATEKEDSVYGATVVYMFKETRKYAHK